MLHNSDVQSAIDRGQGDTLRAAFRILVDWPEVGTIEGIAGADDALNLLRAVSDALVHFNDKHEMPPETAEALNHMTQGPEMVGAPWYAQGATFVLSRLERWRPVFVQAFGDA